MKYTMNSKVRYSEVDTQGKLSWLALFSYLQDCCAFQSEHLEIGVDYLKKNHLAWVVSSWQVCKNAMPKLAEEITVQTWAYGFDVFYGYRNFSIEDSQGGQVAYANSVWVLIDTNTGRPVRIPDEMLELYGTSPQLEMECSSRKIPIPKEYEQEEGIEVLPYFIDTNHHMNNEKYVMLAQNFVPEDFQINEIRVEYKRAAMQGQILYPRVTREAGSITVVLGNEKGQPYATIQFVE